MGKLAQGRFSGLGTKATFMKESQEEGGHTFFFFSLPSSLPRMGCTYSLEKYDDNTPLKGPLTVRMDPGTLREDILFLFFLLFFPLAKYCERRRDCVVRMMMTMSLCTFSNL